MALNKAHMKTIIKRHGHLVIEGDETTNDLRVALYHLREHTWTRCHKENKGVPIESLIPDISVIGMPPAQRNEKGRFAKRY